MEVPQLCRSRILETLQHPEGNRRDLQEIKKNRYHLAARCHKGGYYSREVILKLIEAGECMGHSAVDP